MAGIGSVVVQFRASTTDLVRGTRRVIGEMDRVDRRARSLGGVLTNSLKAGVAGVGVAAVGAGVAFVDMARAAYDDKLAADKLDRALHKVKGTTEAQAEAVADWIDQMELATLVSDDQLRAALEKLLPATEDVTEAQKLAASAWDASITSGKDFEAIVTAMARGVAGNTAALKRMFPWLKPGSDGILTMAEAMEQLNEQFGGDAKKAADDDLFGRIGAAIGQIKEAVGGIALPALEDLSDWFSDKKNLKAVEDWIGKVGDWATAVGEDLAGQIKDFITYLESPEGQKAIADFAQTLRDLADSVGDIGEAVGPTVKALEVLLGWYNALPAPLKGLMGLGDLPSPPSSRPSGGGGGSWGSTPTTSGSKTPRPLNVTINNPRPEKASTSIAAAQRLARNTGRGD